MPMATAGMSMEANGILVLFCPAYDIAADNADDNCPQRS